MTATRWTVSPLDDAHKTESDLSSISVFSVDDMHAAFVMIADADLPVTVLPSLAFVAAASDLTLVEVTQTFLDAYASGLEFAEIGGLHVSTHKEV